MTVRISVAACNFTYICECLVSIPLAEEKYCVANCSLMKVLNHIKT